jgi:hypothetical protein
MAALAVYPRRFRPPDLIVIPTAAVTDEHFRA